MVTFLPIATSKRFSPHATCTTHLILTAVRRPSLCCAYHNPAAPHYAMFWSPAAATIPIAVGARVSGVSGAAGGRQTCFEIVTITNESCEIWNRSLAVDKLRETVKYLTVGVRTWDLANSSQQF